MKLVYFSLAFVFLTGCIIKNEVTFRQGFAINSTTHQINIVGLTKGTARPGDTINLNPGEKITLGTGTAHEGYPGFSSDYFNTVDSLIVTFDNQYKVIHYGVTPVFQSSKSYLNTSNRNILNLNSYLADTARASITYTYEFTEEDYQFAL